MVPPEINARALAATLPQAKLVFLKGVGHMPHHAAPDAVAAAIDELASPRQTALVPRRETRALVAMPA
jgi:pimeloyl-ACP methyl ester carboxylesterase